MPTTITSTLQQHRRQQQHQESQQQQQELKSGKVQCGQVKKRLGKYVCQGFSSKFFKMDLTLQILRFVETKKKYAKSDVTSSVGQKKRKKKICE